MVSTNTAFEKRSEVVSTNTVLLFDSRRVVFYRTRFCEDFLTLVYDERDGPYVNDV